MLRPDEVEQKTALVVDDDPWSRAVVATILFDAGYLVSRASNGFTGLRLARELMPDLILLDVVLPEVSGPMVLSELRRHPATCNVPIILLLPTRHAFAPDELCEADGVLRGPPCGTALLNEIQVAARRRHVANSRASVQRISEYPAFARTDVRDPRFAPAMVVR